MVWFRVDDVLTFHPRVLEAGNAAIGLWVRAGAWSMAQLTDGHVPTAIARQLGSPTEIKRLLLSGLWLPADDGYQFHAWEGRQPTRESVMEKRARDRQRKQEHAEAAAEKRWGRAGDAQDSARKPDGIDAESAMASDASRPVPSRPDPEDPHVSPSSPVPDRANSDETDDRARRRKLLHGLGITDFDRVLTVLAQHVDRPFTEPQAAEIVTAILAKPKQHPEKPQAYVLSSIRKSWAEIQQQYDESVGTDERGRLVAAGIEPPPLEGWTP